MSNTSRKTSKRKINKFAKFATNLGKWADKTFGVGGPTRCLKHLKREVVETLQNPTDRMEYADCFMLIVDAYRRSGCHKGKSPIDDLLKASQDKLKICRKRKWGKPDRQGVISHVRE